MESKYLHGTHKDEHTYTQTDDDDDDDDVKPSPKSNRYKSMHLIA